MNPLASLARLDRLASVLTDAAIRGAFVLLVALVLSHLLRRRSASARHLVWVGAIVVQLVLPAFTLWGPQWQVAIPRTVTSVMPVQIAPDVSNVDAAPISTVASPRAPSRTPTALPPMDAPRSPVTATRRIDGRALLLTLWLAGAVLVLVRLASGTAIVARLARKGNRIDDGDWLSLAQRTSAALGISRPLTLLRGTRLGVPVTWGIVYPVVLLPDDADAWPEERRRFVLVHEMAHVKRLDALTQLAGQLALALFWFDPLVWIANRRMQLEREHACDDYVLRHGTAPSTYAEELLAMVRALGTAEHRTTQPAFAALAMARRSEFEGRMLSILDPVLDRHPLSKGRTLMSTLAALLLVVPIAAFHPHEQAVQVSRRTPMMGVTAEAQTSIGARGESAFASRPAKSPSQSVAAATANSASMVGRPSSSLGKVGASCDGWSAFSTGTHISSHDSDDGSSFISYVHSDGASCASATIIGQLTYSADEDDVIAMPFGSHASFVERTASDERELVLTRSPEGPVVRMYRHRRQDAPYDDAARRWFAGYLPTVLMETGVDIDARLLRWRADGGFDNILTHIEAMKSTSAKRAHYDALLQTGKLDRGELDRLVRSASQSLHGSSSDLRDVLTRAAPQTRLTPQSATALESAVASMSSSADKTAVLEAYGQTEDRYLLISVMRVAPAIGSSGDLARLLQTLAARYLHGDDRTLEHLYFSAVGSITSSSDMRSTLLVAIPYASHSADITKAIIQASRAVASSDDRSAVLISLVDAHALNTKELRDRFFAATEEIASQSDRARVLQAAAGYR